MLYTAFSCRLPSCRDYRQKLIRNCEDIANKEGDREYVLLPQQNFNTYFGNTNFSQNWTGALSKTLIEKKVLDGVGKYKIREIF